jgi:hypothetical protein
MTVERVELRQEWITNARSFARINVGINSKGEIESIITLYSI